jgi:uncharacterized protein (TIGR03435 family)
MSCRLNPATQSFQIDFNMTTMTGFANMITQLFEQLEGTGSRQAVDMTGIKGNYDASVVGAPAGAGERGDVPVASEPAAETHP